ncbi:MAG: hypothetical protein AAFP80_14855 [Pseudomonadota bacterium]
MSKNQRVHIVGISTRSGTTLLAESMGVCFDFDHTEGHEADFDKFKWTKGSYLTKRPNELGSCINACKRIAVSG